MEREGYREALALISSKTDKVILTVTEAAKILGISRPTAMARYNLDGNGISVTELAKRVVAQDAKTRRRERVW